MIRTSRLGAWIGTAILLSALACNLPFLLGDQEQQSSTDGQGIGTLEPGGQLIGVDEVVVAATDGAIEEPVQVRIRRASDPTNDTPLPTSLTQYGSFYHVDAEQDTFAPVENPFLIGLPLPEGAPTDDLALAVLVPAQYIHIDAPPGTDYVEPADEWDFLPAMYDEETNQALAITPSLTASPVTATLISAPYFSSTNSTADATTRAAQKSPGTVALLGGIFNLRLWFLPHARQVDEPDFVAICSPKEDDADAVCEKADLERAADELEDVYNDLTRLGFQLPRLYRQPKAISVDGQTRVADLGAYVIGVRPCTRTGFGRYDSATAKAWACDGGRMASTIRHEYFHATQYAYEAVLMGEAESWYLEGQATASQQSETVLTRDSERGLREIDRSLRGENGVYRTQDFWLYIGKKLNADLTFLIPLFDYPPNAQGLNAAILEEYPSLQNLPSVYWDWVKNQSFEKEIDIGNLGFTCSLSSDALGQPAILTVTDDTTGRAPRIVYDPQLPPDDKIIELDALDSAVFEIQFPPPADGSYSAVVRVLRDNPLARSKFYDPTDFRTTDCREVPDAESANVQVGSEMERLFVVVANSDIGDTAVVCISFELQRIDCKLPPPSAGLDRNSEGNDRGEDPQSGPEGVPPAGAGSAACLLGTWTLDNDSYLAFLQSLDMPDVTFTDVGGSYTLAFEAGGVVHTADHTVLGVTTPQGSIDVKVNEDGSTEYWTEDGRLHMAGGQLLSASIGGGLEVEDARPGGSAPYGCQGDLLALYLQEESPPLVWHREGP